LHGRFARGFTLIELLVVIGVVALFVALAVPAVEAISGANARKSAAELAGAMRYLFDTAALRHATCRLALDVDARSWWAECAPGRAGIARDPEREARPVEPSTVSQVDADELRRGAKEERRERRDAQREAEHDDEGAEGDDGDPEGSLHGASTYDCGRVSISSCSTRGSTAPGRARPGVNAISGAGAPSRILYPRLAPR